MDVKKNKQYSINNKIKYYKFKIIYYNNKEVRRKDNNEYRALHGHKYIEARSKSIEYKMNHRIYNGKYREKAKYIHNDNYFHTKKI
jgi:hypothetical protein